MAKLIGAEDVRAGLRHAVVCPNVAGRANGRIAQSKRVLAASLAIKVDKSQVARTRTLQAFGVQMSCCISVRFCLFCYVLVLMPSLKPRPFIQSFFDMYAP